MLSISHTSLTGDNVIITFIIIVTQDDTVTGSTADVKINQQHGRR